MSPQRPFRAIVVGGGPTGLILAHCLEAAKIDYVLLERRPEAVELSGSGFGIWPQGARVLAQLGLLEKARELTAPMGNMIQLNPDGSTIMNISMYSDLDKSMGFPFLMYNRSDYCRLLWDNLPNKERVKGNKRVVSVEQNDEYAKVVLSDGSEEIGDIVVGCDGVYSAVRNAVKWSAKQKVIPMTSSKDETAYSAEYRCLFGTSSLPPGNKTGEMCITFSQGASLQAFTVKDKSLWILYEKLPVETNARKAYSEDEERAFAEKYADLAADYQGMKFKSLWERCEKAKASILDEGMYEKWFDGRIVLVGDAAHKMTPNLANGYNAGLQGVVSLTNQLYQILNTDLSSKPSAEEIKEAFSKYQTHRFPLALKELKNSAQQTRLNAWDTVSYKYLSKYIPKILPYWILLKTVTDYCKTGVCLTCLPKPVQEGALFTVNFDDEEGEEVGMSMGAMAAILLCLAVILGILGTGKGGRELWASL